MVVYFAERETMTKLQEIGRVVLNKRIAPDIYWMSIAAPNIARAAKPGQFVHVRMYDEPSVQFLRMPFCVYDASDVMQAVDICYAVVGEGTKQLTKVQPGGFIDLMGPIGNGWTVPEGTKRALLVGGGVGTPALNLLGRKLATSNIKVDAVIGAQTASKLVCLEHIECSTAPSGGKIHITTDDGTQGTHGFVTELTDPMIASGDYDYVAVCGPTPMMANVVKPAIEHGVACQVSMEKLMACGVGACLSCVLETTSGRKRCCVDGPVFNADEVVW